MTKFTKIYNSFYGEKIDRPDQIEKIEMNGKELEDFCNFYYKEFSIFNFDEYELLSKIQERNFTRLLWLTLGFIFACLLIVGTLYANGKV